MVTWVLLCKEVDKTKGHAAQKKGRKQTKNVKRRSKKFTRKENEKGSGQVSKIISKHHYPK